jgi:hypothetical protein
MRFAAGSEIPLFSSLHRNFSLNCANPLGWPPRVRSLFEAVSFSSWGIIEALAYVIFTVYISLLFGKERKGRRERKGLYVVI